MLKKTTVIADHREQRSACYQWLKNQPTLNVEIATLSVGDYEIGSCVIERKTLRDFALSVIDGRLFSQMRRLLAKKRPVLIIEGDPADMGQYGLSRNALQGALITLSVVYGIPVLYALDATESGQLMLYTAQQDYALRQGISARPGYGPKTRTKRQCYILQGLPHIGSQRAQCLLAHFGSVRAVLNASAKELQTVAGIGPKTAAMIEEIVR